MQIVNDNLIKKWEKLELKAYMPTPNDVPTIGWGHTHTTKMGMYITEKKAQELFDRDVAWVEKAMAKHINVAMSQHQYDAVASWIFNVGETAFIKSTLLRKLNAGDYEGAARELPRWNKQSGKVLRGLVRRRAEEMEYFLSEDVDEPHGVPDKVEDLKSLSKSKELIAGGTAVATAVGGVLGGLSESAQSILSVGLSVALLGFGAYVIYNRMSARKRAER
tara:strand:- start:2179 stop:2838 length:660 start_codon:yes stop_codon:yes gene_type:complete